jgi:hypothetical protein
MITRPSNRALNPPKEWTDDPDRLRILYLHRHHYGGIRRVRFDGHQCGMTGPHCDIDPEEIRTRDAPRERHEAQGEWSKRFSAILIGLPARD